MRLFIGINFEDRTRAALVSLLDDLQAKSTRGRFTLPENLHLTLVFLGECDDSQRAIISDVMNEITCAPFPIEIDRIGVFKRNGGDIWWAGFRASKQLLDLQSELARRLKAQGFPIETRKYSPHITLARQVTCEEQPRTISPFGETVTSIDLIESTRINEKLTYVPIFTTKL
jgi:2'-5' RNA ligase